MSSLRQGGAPNRRMRRLAAKSPRRTGPDCEVRELVFQRDMWRCIICGREVGAMPASIHHRKPRGMGGTKDPSVNKPSNLIVLCGTGTTGCHGRVEGDRAHAREEGWLISQWADPVEVPIRYSDGNMYYLTDTGDKEETPPCS